MVGVNSIVLCQAEMKAALEHYLKEKVFRPEQNVVVTGIEHDGRDGVYKIILDEPTPVKQEG